MLIFSCLKVGVLWALYWRWDLQPTCLRTSRCWVGYGLIPGAWSSTTSGRRLRTHWLVLRVHLLCLSASGQRFRFLQWLQEKLEKTAPRGTLNGGWDFTGRSLELVPAKCSNMAAVERQEGMYDAPASLSITPPAATAAAAITGQAQGASVKLTSLHWWQLVQIISQPAHWVSVGFILCRCDSRGHLEASNPGQGLV